MHFFNREAHVIYRSLHWPEALQFHLSHFNFVSLCILVVKTQFCPSILPCLHCFKNCSSEIICHYLNVSVICFWECCLFVVSLKGLEENVSNNKKKWEWGILQKEWIFKKGNNFQEFLLRRKIVKSVIGCDSNSELITAYTVLLSIC